MKKNSRLAIAAALAMALAIAGSGCRHRSGNNPPPVNTTPVDPYYGSWYDVYGHYCSNQSPMPGCNFYGNGAKIKDFQDPLYSQKFLEYSSNWTYTDSYGYRQAYTGYAWLSGTGILYDEFGRALNELGDDNGRDILGQAAQAESSAIEGAGQTFASRFALSEDRAIEIARSLNDWAVLGKSRSRTDAAVADFSQRIYGVSAAAAADALAAADSGNLEAAQKLNRQVAAYWGTSAETSQAILSAWFSEEAADLTKAAAAK